MSNDTKNPYPDKCPIWGTPAQIHDANRDGKIVDSPRTGGRYFISGSALAFLEHPDNWANTACDDRKRNLTSWMVRQRISGNPEPEIFSDTFEDVGYSTKPTVLQRCHNLLRYLDKSLPRLGDKVTFIPDTVDAHFFELLAWTDSLLEQELEFIIDFCIDAKWIIKSDYNIGEAIFSSDLFLKSHGYVKLEEIQKPENDPSDIAFVAMWFDESMDDVYETGIRKGIEDAGYEPLRIKDQEYNGQVHDEIIASIRRSHFMVADFSHGNDGARGSVYYEAGFAKGLGLEVIFTCRDSQKGKIHFDTSQYNHIFWKDVDDLRARLKARISATIGDGPVKH